MSKAQIIGELAQNYETLYRRVQQFRIASASPPEIVRGEIELPLSVIARHFQNLNGIVNHPEVGRNYPLWRFYKRIASRDATSESEAVLGELSLDKLEETRDTVRRALEIDVVELLVAYQATDLIPETAYEILGGVGAAIIANKEIFDNIERHVSN